MNKTSIKFTKMHGLGNDFMVIDAVNQAISLTPQQIRQLAHRQRGIGFDQCLLIEAPTQADVDFNYRIFNADGSEVAQCGNGARCLARFIHERKLSNNTHLRVATLQDKLELIINPDHTITVNLAIPRFAPADIPLTHVNQQTLYTLELNSQAIAFHALSIGNPHAVIVVKEVATAEVDTIGQQLNQHPYFPQGVNVGFMQIIDAKNIKLRVFERGVGETQACGSGACAAMICGKQFHGMAEHVTVALPGGNLHIAWHGLGQPVYLTGEATTVYEGIIWL